MKNMGMIEQMIRSHTGIEAKHKPAGPIQRIVINDFSPSPEEIHAIEEVMTIEIYEDYRLHKIIKVLSPLSVTLEFHLKK